MVVNIKDANIEQLHAFVEQYLPPKELESKIYGEVFTPLTLVDEMLTAVEKYGNMTIWKDPDIKILDPAAGIGNFPLIAYQKLMKGLTRKISNEEQRRKHILENMLYMVELNPINVRLMKKIFGIKNYKLNILNTSFLLESPDDIRNAKDMMIKQIDDGKKLLEWKKLKFDLIIGNPPFKSIMEHLMALYGISSSFKVLNVFIQVVFFHLFILLVGEISKENSNIFKENFFPEI